MRLTRSGLLEVIHEGYVQTARAKGLTERVVVFPHAIRNALIPIVTVVGLQFGTLLGGTVIVETVFSWPGIAEAVVTAALAVDFPMLAALSVLATTAVLAGSVLADVAVTLADPRVVADG